MKPTSLVIDTHWVLDLWAFDDPRAAGLRAAIASNQVCWLACAAMRDELARVLTYPRIAAFLARRAAAAGRAPDQAPSHAAQQALAAFDRYARLQPDPPAALARCRDPDDQVFIDLAVAHRATLLSRDRAVLALARALRGCGVDAQADWPGAIPANPPAAAGIILSP